jgi:hypothetical protein
MYVSGKVLLFISLWEKMLRNLLYDLHIKVKEQYIKIILGFKE